MTFTVASLIERAFDVAYRNEMILTENGMPFVVRRTSVDSDMDGLHVMMYDRGHGTNINYLCDELPYDPVKETRSLCLSDTDALPTIVNLAWDKKAKVWTPIKSRYERGDKPDPLNLS